MIKMEMNVPAIIMFVILIIYGIRALVGDIITILE